MYISEKNFALLGMAGIMSGVMHAPLTGVFLIAALTGGYDLFLPLIDVYKRQKLENPGLFGAASLCYDK